MSQGPLEMFSTAKKIIKEPQKSTTEIITTEYRNQISEMIGFLRFDQNSKIVYIHSYLNCFRSKTH